MHEFCAAAARALAEIVRLHEHHAKPARRGIHSHTHTGRTAADYRNVPRLLLLSALADLAQHLVPAHHFLQSLIPSSSSTAPPRAAIECGVPLDLPHPCAVQTVRRPDASCATLQAQPRT